MRVLSVLSVPGDGVSGEAIVPNVPIVPAPPPATPDDLRVINDDWDDLGGWDIICLAPGDYGPRFARCAPIPLLTYSFGRRSTPALTQWTCPDFPEVLIWNGQGFQELVGSGDTSYG